MIETLLIHATAVAIDGHAVLLRGPSGAGKSDLGLRLIDAGGRLVADDQSEMWRQGDLLMVRSPAALAGLLEVRGIGIVRLAALSEAPVALVADLVPPGQVERLPTPCNETLLGLVVPRVVVAPFEASAAAKIRLALGAFTAAELPAMLSI